MAADEVGPGTLKLVSGYSPERGLRKVIESTLRKHIKGQDIRYVFGRMFVVHTSAEPSEIRDWLAGALQAGESAFVVEFERWSGWGAAIDDTWLLRRGH